MTTTPVRYTSSGQGGVTIASCTQCGSLVGDPVKHGQNCPRIKPPPPPPIDTDRVAVIIGRHRVHVRLEGTAVIVGCSCGVGGDGDMSITDYDHHAATMIRQYGTPER